MCQTDLRRPVVVNYDLVLAPQGYVCSKCRQTDIKLWRPNDDQISLTMYCATCASEIVGNDPLRRINGNGHHFDGLAGMAGMFVDTIGEMHPAYPVNTGNTLSLYRFDAPEQARQWWSLLPILPLGSQVPR